MTGADAENRLEELVTRVAELERDRDQLRDRVDELERELESRASLQWKSNQVEDIVLESPDSFRFPLGRVITAKVSEEQFAGLVDDVEKLKREGVDPEDLVGLRDDDEMILPIEDQIAKLRSDIRENPSANKQRATVVFRAFGGRARTRNGKLRIESADVKNILEEKAGIAEPNPNTVGRTMRQCAKLTSSKSKEDRDPRDDENLLTLTAGRNGNELIADRDEWRNYLAEVEGRYR